MMSCLNYVNAQVSMGFDLFADVIWQQDDSVLNAKVKLDACYCN